MNNREVNAVIQNSQFIIMITAIAGNMQPLTQSSQ